MLIEEWTLGQRFRPTRAGSSPCHPRDANENYEVEPQALFVDVLEIALNPVVAIADAVAATHL